MVLLASCTTIDQEEKDAAVPDAPETFIAHDASDQMLPSDWVASFRNDTLTALVNEALAQNKTIGAAAGRLQAAWASVKVTNAGRLPTLSGSVDGRRSSTPIETGGIFIDPNGNVVENPNTGIQRNNNGFLSVGLQTRWELDLWGRIDDQVRASRADARASQADWNAALLSVAGAVANAWFGLTEAHLQTELAREDLETQRRFRDITMRRFEAGLNSSRDVRLALSSVAAREATVAQREQLEAEAARRLEILLGRYPSAELESVKDLPTLVRLEGTGAPADILARRPDVRAAEQRLEAAGFRILDARKALLPSVTFTASADITTNTLGELFDLERVAGNLITGLTQPLFQGGRLLANIKVNKGRAVTALNDYAGTVLDAYLEAENALAAENLLAEREAALAESAKQADAAEILTEREYARGLATIFDLLNAQGSRINAKSALITARAQRLTNRVQFYLAIGGRFDTAAAQNRLGKYGGKDDQ